MITQIIKPSVTVIEQALAIHKESFTDQQCAPSRMFLHRVNTDFFFVDLVDGEVRGYAIVEDRRPFWWLWEMAVSLKYRRQGIGGELLDAVEETARGIGEPGIELSVRADNAEAWKLYRRKNYTDVRRLKRYYFGCDGILMRRDIC